MLQGANDVPQGEAGLRIEARTGLVEKQYLRFVRDRASDLHALRQPAGEYLDEGFLALGQLKEFKQFGSAFRGASVRYIRSSGSGSKCSPRWCIADRGY